MAPKQKQPEPEPELVDDEEIDLGDDEEDDGDYGDDEMGFDLGAVLEPFLATEDGQTICTALVTISKHMEMQNKILVKILTQLSKKETS
jgi:hypothetical protein